MTTEIHDPGSQSYHARQGKRAAIMPHLSGIDR